MMLDVKKYIPHRDSMHLIDSVVEINDASTICKTTITKNNIFYEPLIGGVYAWVGIEFMAQASAVYYSFLAGATKPRIGFLVNVKKFFATQPYLKLNDILTITISKEYLEDNVGLFNGVITIDQKLIVSSQLTAFQPYDEQITKL
jgi:predicted hotdog family 3-hydroxylacyl-ACP dehydratase